MADNDLKGAADFGGSILRREFRNGRVLLLDAADSWLLEDWNVTPKRSNRSVYVQAYRQLRRVRIRYPLHRLLLGVHDMDWRTVQVDHISGDTFDNRRENLRLCTAAENNASRRLAPSQHGYRGIEQQCRCASGRVRWYARIGDHENRQQAGPFDTPEEAALAYNELALARFGEFARLNIVPAQGVTC